MPPFIPHATSPRPEPGSQFDGPGPSASLPMSNDGSHGKLVSTIAAFVFA